MNKQPFLIVTKEDGTKVIINENHVVTILCKSSNIAQITLSTGEVILVSDPNFEAWENDCLIRKD